MISRIVVILYASIKQPFRFSSFLISQSTFLFIMSCLIFKKGVYVPAHFSDVILE